MSGNRRSNPPGPRAPSGVLSDIRRMAILKDLEKQRSSGGNAKANSPGSAPSNMKKVGDVKAPAQEPPDKNKGAEFEGTPPFSKESLGGDGWGKAAEHARQMFAEK